MDLGKLTKIDDLRSIWPHEAKDFTPWLAQEENLNLLGDAIGLDITLEGVEVPVGSFNIDILAKETGSDRRIIIENQLEDTNHDHLGKTITYAAGKDASYIIWIVKTAREEHQRAIEWLNSHTDETIHFFLVEIELWTIDNSKKAPKFNIVERSNDWAKSVNASNKELADREVKRIDFWSALNEYAWNNADFAKEFKKHKPSPDHWYNLSIGKSGVHIALLMIQRDNNCWVEFYIENDKVLYKKLEAEKDNIEQIIGCKLDWRELPDKKASRILLCNPQNADFSNSDTWTSQFDWFKKYATLFKKAFCKYL